ncbi:hypothetical protein D030_1834B, partial [Vibrio parahaemolyticus AQ3810]
SVLSVHITKLGT